jgi:hypothetical protein
VRFQYDIIQELSRAARADVPADVTQR